VTQPWRLPKNGLKAASNRFVPPQEASSPLCMQASIMHCVTLQSITIGSFILQPVSSTAPPGLAGAPFMPETPQAAFHLGKAAAIYYLFGVRRLSGLGIQPPSHWLQKFKSTSPQHMLPGGLPASTACTTNPAIFSCHQAASVAPKWFSGPGPTSSPTTSQLMNGATWQPELPTSALQMGHLLEAAAPCRSRAVHVAHVLTWPQGASAISRPPLMQTMQESAHGSMHRHDFAGLNLIVCGMRRRGSSIGLSRTRYWGQDAWGCKLWTMRRACCTTSVK
jgi:hypothetical protein